MQPTDQPVAILFADICDSTPLYEESGDASALAVIARCLDDLAGIAANYDGAVIRSKGDDLLCTFDMPQSALDAAEAMIELHGVGIPAIHVGIHFGPVIRARQDIYGDAVNVAARMLALAKPGETVTSRDLVEALPDYERSRLAFLGRRVIKGKTEPMEIFSMVLDDGAATQMVRGSGSEGIEDEPPQTIIPAVVVELEFEGEKLRLQDGDTWLIGRADRCQLQIADLRVSREHARIEIRGGSATFTDQSSTGSWVIDADGSHTTLRREACTLRGHGTLRLGRHPAVEQAAPQIGFSVHMDI